jgi:hypothetical protein
VQKFKDVHNLCHNIMQIDVKLLEQCGRGDHLHRALSTLLQKFVKKQRHLLLHPLKEAGAKADNIEPWVLCLEFSPRQICGYSTYL